MTQTDSEVGSYLSLIARLCTEVVGRTEAIWAVGSWVLGDFEAGRSDLDVLVVSSTPPDRRTKERLAGVLSHEATPCPAHGLDLVLYPREEIARPRRAPRFAFSLASGHAWEDEVEWGGPYAGGLIDLAVARQSGEPLHGATPEAVVGPIPDGWILAELVGALRWHRGRIHDPFHDPTGANAVLNACRALHFRERRRFVSKTEGARWLLERRSEAVVERALARRGGAGGPRDGGDVRLDAEAVGELLEAALEEMGETE